MTWYKHACVGLRLTSSYILRFCWSQLEKPSGPCECGGCAARWASLHTHMVVVERSQAVSPSSCMMKQAVTRTWSFAVPYPSTTSTTEKIAPMLISKKAFGLHAALMLMSVCHLGCVWKTGAVPERCPTQELLLFWWPEGQRRGGLLWSQMIVELSKDSWTICRRSRHHGRTFFGAAKSKWFEQLTLFLRSLGRIFYGLYVYIVSWQTCSIFFCLQF